MSLALGGQAKAPGIRGPNCYFCYLLPITTETSSAPQRKLKD
jgi:hypothetical protein